MYDSPVASPAETAELLRLLGRLADPDGRRESAEALARLLGGEELLLFAPDPELHVILPAPGFPQVMKDATRWRQLLELAAVDGSATATLPLGDGRSGEVQVCATPEGTAAALINTRQTAAGVSTLRPVLPLLGALFHSERQLAAEAIRAQFAAEAVARSTELSRSLQRMQQRLEDALVEAEGARAAARERAEQAERLGEELQAQAEQLQEQAMELEMLNDELRARSHQAESARAAAAEANRAKSEFLANMSHELRTPINAVIGYADLLNLGITGPVTPEQQAQLERIRLSSAHLLTLVNDVLDIAKVEAGQMTVAHEQEPVEEAITEAIALIEGQATARRLSVENLCGDSTATYFGDGDRVRQILVNLLSNAVKFTEPGGRIVIDGGSAERADLHDGLGYAGPWRYITIEDSGIGMTPDELSRIFQPFVQAESGHTRVRGGTGLGLTISQQFARLMGGDLTVQSEKGEGSCFTLWLPSSSPVSTSRSSDPSG